MGRPGLARTALAAVALGVPTVGVIVVPAAAANAAPLAASQPQRIIHAPKVPAPEVTLNSELASYAKHLEETLPTAADKAFIRDVMKEPGWIAPRNEITQPS